MVASRWRACAALVAVLAWPAISLNAQTLTVEAAGDTLKVRVSGFSFLSGEPVARLKDGRSVRIELAAMVLHGAEKKAAATTRRIIALSYDLWEERFAVTTVGPRSRSASHLALAAAETWCVDQVAIPLNALGALGRDASFWVRLEYHIVDGDAAAQSPDAGYTLQGMIDLFSRRRKTSSTGSGASTSSGPASSTSPTVLEGGPFKMPRGSPSPR